MNTPQPRRSLLTAPDRDRIRADAARYAADVLHLCKLFGRLDLAAEFISRQMSIALVRRNLEVAGAGGGSPPAVSILDADGIRKHTDSWGKAFEAADGKFAEERGDFYQIPPEL